MTLEELERLRNELKKTYLLWIVIFIVIVILNIVVILSTKMVFLAPVSIIVGIILFAVTTNKKKRAYVLAFKDYFVLNSLKATFTDLIYEPEKGIPRSEIADTQMMYMGDIYSSNDFVSGKYKNIDFHQSDVHIEEEHTTTDSDGNTTTEYITIFRGRWMVFDFNKEFKSNIQVCQKRFGNNKVGSIFSKSKYKKVEMESQEFNKMFNVYAQSEHEAFYILTPTLMEKITNLVNNTKGKVLLCFIDNKLHIGLYDNKDSFEPGSVFKQIDEAKVNEEINKDVKTITNFVDYLSLDNDLFRKGV